MSAWQKLPTLRALTARLRDLNEAFAHPEGGPGSVCLWWEGSTTPALWPMPFGAGGWVCGTSWEGWSVRVGPEEIPGNDTFDAVACARRLLADARAKGFK